MREEVKPPELAGSRVKNMEVKDQAAVTVAQPVVTQTPKDHVTITIDQPVTQLPQEEDKKNKFLVVASNGCMVRKTPDFDSPLVKVLDHNSVIETTTAEPAHANHPLVLSGTRVRVVSPVCGYASMVGQKDGKPILSEVLETAVPTVTRASAATHGTEQRTYSDNTGTGTDPGTMICISIFTLICCLWPCGIAALVKSCEASAHHNSRRYDAEQNALKSAQTWAAVSFFGGLVVWIIILASNA